MPSREGNQFNNMIVGKNTATVPKSLRAKYMEEKKLDMTTVLNEEIHKYKLQLPNGVSVSARFPREEMKLDIREFQIRNALQGIFTKIYNIDDGTAMIMANMDSEEDHNVSFCEQYGLLSRLPKAKKLLNNISHKTIEFDLRNTIPSLKLDGEYYRYSKFSENKFPTIQGTENINFDNVEIDQFDGSAVLNRFNTIKEMFQEAILGAKEKYTFDIKTIENNTDYIAYIISDEEVDGALYEKGYSEKVPVFKVTFEKATDGTFFLDYRSDFFGYNGSDMRLLNDKAIKNHIRIGLLAAIHSFTNNVIESI